MLLEARIWQTLNLIAIIVSALATLYSGLRVPSPFTEKRLQRSLTAATDVTGQLSKLGDKAKVSIIIDNRPVKNLVLSMTGVTNTGSIAILPSDFYEPLSITVDKQWEILLVQNLFGAQHPIWKKVTDQQFKSSPELLNSGDAIWINVYATNTQHEHLTYEQVQQFIPVWSAHILNLRNITPKENLFAELNADPLRRIVPFTVDLSGSALVVTLTAAVILMIVYINLLYYLGVLAYGRWKSLAAIIGVGVISLTASEATATYLFPNIVNRIEGISNWLNMPWIVVNFILLVTLSAKAWKKGRTTTPLSRT
jgi:hypothetical protein